MRPRTRPSILVLVAALVLAACQPIIVPVAPTPEPTPPIPAEPQPEPTAAGIPITQESLVANPWQWVSLVETAPTAQSVVPSPNDYTLTFKPDNTVAIQADCNTAQGTYILRRSRLLIELGPSTTAFCGEDSLDQQFLALLTQVDEGSQIDGGLRLLLADNAGYMNFQPASELDISPEDIRLDTQGLPYSWQPVVVLASPYDESMPPGPMGMPEHIEILFGVTDPAARQPGDPVMYLIPANAYRQMWDAAGNPGVTETIEQIEQLSFSLPSPAPISGLPALPYEQAGAGYNDLAAQVGRAVSYAELNTISSTQTGYRFVGRWAQDANPVTNQGLRYVFQGFTNDGKYLVSFWYPVSTTALPDEVNQVPADQLEQFNNDPTASIQAQAEVLNALAPEEWEPDLATLDALVASLEIDGMPVAGIQDTIWQWVEGPVQPGSADIVPVEDPERYQVIYGSDGMINFVADCNRGSMSYELRQGGMAGGMLAQAGPMTLAECEPGSLYQGFANSLMAAQDYRVRAGGETLELVLPAGGGVLILRSAGPAGVTPPAVVPTPTPPVAATTPVPTASPQPTATPAPVIELSANPTAIQVGQCTTLSWRVENVQAAWVYPQGANYRDFPVTGLGSRQECPVATTTYEMRVLLTDDNVQFHQVTVNVQVAPVPVIEFSADPTSIQSGHCTFLSWRVENVQAIWVYPQGADYQDYPVTGQGNRQECPVVTTTYEMRVLLYNGAVEQRQVTIEVSPSDPLAGTVWALSSLFVDQALIPDTAITLSFSTDGRISGNGGCNDYGGPYAVQGETLLIGGIAATQALCGEEIDHQEQSYLAALQSAVSFELTGNQLVMYNPAGKEILRYNRTS